MEDLSAVLRIICYDPSRGEIRIPSIRLEDAIAIANALCSKLFNIRVDYITVNDRMIFTFYGRVPNDPIDDPRHD